jgi:hypothetical protein
MLADQLQPSARELIADLDRTIGLGARWELESVLSSLLSDKELTRFERAYVTFLLEADDLVPALRGKDEPDWDTVSTIDALFRASALYRNSASFREMIDFMARFRHYSPYNNMLVKIQNPNCSLYATAKRWHDRFERSLKQDARPMLILAPKHPVMLVYDLDETEGKDLPAELRNFAQFTGRWEPRWLERLIKNANRHKIRIDLKVLSSTRAGVVALADPTAADKMRVSINRDLRPLSRFGVLCHEIAHILLGHLGSDVDNGGRHVLISESVQSKLKQRRLHTS